MLAAAICSAQLDEVVAPVEAEGGIQIDWNSDAISGDSVASDERTKRHRPFLAGLVLGSAIRRPYYYGGYGGYGGYRGYGGHGGYYPYGGYG